MANQAMDDLLTQDKGGILLYRAGDTIQGIVLDLNKSRILLELEGGLTGIITKKEMVGYGNNDEITVGSTLESVVLDPENEQGLVVLSLKRASQDMVWADLNTLMSEERIVTVKIYEANKGGLMANFKGLKCFLPVSQLTPLNYPRVDGAEASQILKKLQEHVGKEFAVRVINVDRENGKVIISEKAAHQQQIKDTLKTLKEGDTTKGEVSGVLKYGIFVTFGGVEGLVHLSELDWGHISDPSKHYKLGDKVDVMVIGIDGDKLSLSMKRLTDDPWKDRVKDYEVGQNVTGKVVRWNSQGVFIEISEDVQGLFLLEVFDVEDYNELSVQEGDELEGIIEEINYDSHRLELKKADAKKTKKK